MDLYVDVLHMVVEEYDHLISMLMSYRCWWNMIWGSVCRCVTVGSGIRSVDLYVYVLQVLVEYDDVEWHRREWISIYKDRMFHAFLVEHSLFWAEREDPLSTSGTCTALWPALVSELIETSLYSVAILGLITTGQQSLA